MSEIIFGGRLVALQKKDGGIRPIAVGYTLRRIAAKCANAFVINRRSDALKPIQIGVGVSGGAEAAVHASRKLIQNLPETHVFVKLDFSNAFNTVRRDLILQKTAITLPEIYRFIHASLTCNSQLSFNNHIVLSSEGAQQGDPLGSLEFCESIQDTLLQTISDVTLAYIDDVNLEGEVREVATKIQMIMDAESTTGLQLNLHKCEITCRNFDILDDFPVFHHFKHIAPRDITMLGSPVLGGQAVDNALMEKTTQLKQAISRLSSLPAHDAFCLLKNSLAMPKLLYTLRTSPCSGNPLLDEFDKILKCGLSTILNIDISDQQWQQASLPVHKGGLGVRSARQLAPSAFLASAAATLSLQEAILSSSKINIQPDSSTQSALNEWTTMTTTPQPDSTNKHIQQAWDSRICDTVFQQLTSNTSNSVEHARLLAASAPHSGDWLHAPPLTAIGLRLSNEAIRVAIGYRIGAIICEPHTCPCGSTVDARGLHALSCRKSGPRHIRHAQLNDLLWRAIKKAQVPASKEPIGLTRTDGKRPDGVTLVPWTRGRPLAWDVTVPDTFATSHINTTSLSAGAAAEDAAKKKIAKYSGITNTHHFVPVAVETGGAWCTASAELVADLGRRITSITNDPRETSFLFQRLTIALQRGNAVAFSHSFISDN